MVKAYLRYDGEKSIGVITSRDSNVAVDASGKLALTGSVEAVNVWNLRQGQLQKSLVPARSSDRVTRVCLKKGDAPVCAVGYSDGTVRLWNFTDGSVLQTLQGHRSGVSCIAFDASGHFLASGANDTDIIVWDVTTEVGVARLRGHVDQVTAVVFWDATPGLGSTSKVISASKDRIIRIWSVETQICLQAISEHQSEVWSLALNGSGSRLVAGSGDKFLRMWSLNSESMEDGEGEVAVFMGAVPRPNGQGAALELEYARPKATDFEVLFCLGAGKILEMFRCHDESDIAKRLKRRRRRKRSKLNKQEGKPEEDGADEGEGVDAADDQQDGPSAADELAELSPQRLRSKAASMAWNAANGEIIIGLCNNELEAFKLTISGEDSSLGFEKANGVDLPGHRTAIRALAISHDDSLLMSAGAESVKVWNTSTGNCVRTMASGYGLCGFFLAGGEQLVLGTKEGNLELYDMRIAEMSLQVDAHSGPVYGVVAAPDRKTFVTCSADKTVKFFKVFFTKNAGEESVSIEEEQEKAQEMPDECLSVAYSANGKWVAVALLNHTIQMIFADTMKFYLSLYGHRLPVMSLAISSDSQMVASGSADKTVKLWSTQFGNCHRSLRAHNDSVMQVQFLPGSHYLATASRDRELKLWDCDSYELITTLKGHAAEILAMNISQDASFIVTASSDRQVRFWKRSQEQMFISEERSKELEDRFEQEVERDDLQGESQIVAVRPSRRTIESVRTTEKLMEILDEAGDAVQNGDGNQCARVVAHVNTLNANNVYEVLLALPFAHALRLLGYISEFLDALSRAESAKSTVFSAAATLETPCQVALIAAYVHHHELAATSSARSLVLRLRERMQSLLQAEKDRIGFNIAGFGHLQRVLNRNQSIKAVFTATPKTAKETKAGKRKRS